MSAHGWLPPTGATRDRSNDRFAGPGPAPAAQPYGAAPGPGGRVSAPYDVADLPWAWTGAAEPPVAVGPEIGPAPFPGTEHVDLAATLQGPGYEGRPPRTDPIAILALVVGMLGVIPWVGLGAIALGHVALWRLRQNPYMAGHGPALTGTVLGYLTVGMHVLIELFLETLRSLF